MDVTYDSAMDSALLRNFFSNSKPKKHIEFGPGIFLIKDSRNIFVESEKNNTLKSKNEFATKHFSLWKGNDVIDISKLRKYQDFLDILQIMLRIQFFQVLNDF